MLEVRTYEGPQVVLLWRKFTFFILHLFTIREQYLDHRYEYGYTTILDHDDELLEALVG